MVTVYILLLINIFKRGGGVLSKNWGLISCSHHVFLVLYCEVWDLLFYIYWVPSWYPCSDHMQLPTRCLLARFVHGPYGIGCLLPCELFIIQAELPFTNNTHELAAFVYWEESITHKHRRLLPKRCCSNHGPVLDVLAQNTSRLDYAVFVKGTSAWIIVTVQNSLCQVLNNCDNIVTVVVIIKFQCKVVTAGIGVLLCRYSNEKKWSLS